jgi:glycosyltransferase involved in cell wall biosynthesis
MRIVVVSDFFVPSRRDLDRQTGHLAAALADEHDVWVAADSGSDDTFESQVTSADAAIPVPVLRLPFSSALLHRRPASVLRCVSDLRSLLTKVRPDVVVAECLATGAFYLQQTRDLTSALVVRMAVPIGRVPGSAMTTLRATFDRSAVIGCPSTAMVEAWTAAFPSIASRTVVIRELIGRRATSWGSSAISGCADLVGLIGRVDESKGMHIAFEAVAAAPNRRLLVIGDGPQRPLLQARAAQPDLEGRVSFVGWREREEALAMLRTCDVVVVPSLWSEPFGTVAVEAQDVGVPVIVSDAGGLAEAGGAPAACVVVPAGDVDALRSALNDLDDPHRREQLRAAGHANARANDAQSLQSDRTALAAAVTPRQSST